MWFPALPGTGRPVERDMMTKPTKKQKQTLRTTAREVAERDVLREAVTLEDAEDAEPWRVALFDLGSYLDDEEKRVFAKAYTEQVIALCKEY